MDVRQLRYFATLAEEKHFGRAAKRLGMSQPPLSLAIRQIESELQTPLFSRNSRNVELTRAGVALQREARLLLRQFDEAKALVKAVAEGKEGRLRVGFGGSMIYRGLPQIVDLFRKHNPGIDLMLTELNSVEQIAAIKRDEIDFGFVLGANTAAELNGFRFHSEPFVACVPLHHPAAKARTLKLDRLKNDEFVLFSRNASPHYFESIVSICVAHGFMPKVKHESSSLDERGVLRRIRYGCVTGPQDLGHTTHHRGQVRGDFGSARAFGNLVRVEGHRSAAWSESLDRPLQRPSAKNG